MLPIAKDWRLNPTLRKPRSTWNGFGAPNGDVELPELQQPEPQESEQWPGNAPDRPDDRPLLWICLASASALLLIAGIILRSRRILSIEDAGEASLDKLGVFFAGMGLHCATYRTIGPWYARSYLFDYDWRCRPREGS
jgi:hypothetical protein